MMNVAAGIALMAAAATAQPNTDMISAAEALALGRKVPEAEALYAVQGGRWASCIESKAVRSCESDWVTCVEDGWVVSFFFGDRCALKHDGRLSVTVLINGKTKQMISRFPEKEYFADPSFCRDAHDCLPVEHSPEQTPVCQNFIFSQLSGVADEGACRCAENACEINS